MTFEPFSLLHRCWLPVRRRSGARARIAPYEIAEVSADDPVIRPDWGRADLDAATLEFLIGLLATACPPTGLGDWRGRYRHPPSPDELSTTFAPLAHAFVLDGDGPRFMQELGDLTGEATPVSGLFIEAPGANTEKNNADLFQKRGRLPALGLPAAAIALFALQTFAPSGGAGHRTSLRGGGPLTTLALPAVDQDRPLEEATLWRRLWLNVPISKLPLPADLWRVFPWLAPTRTSEGSTPPLGEDDIDARGVFWGMPRRIRLDIASLPGTRCGLTGDETERSVASYRTRPWGMNYGTLAHPLSPMYRQKVGSEWLYVHPQPGGLSYRHWIDMATAGKEMTMTRRPAPVVLWARERLDALDQGSGRLWAAGFDMDNMKARGFVETTFPLFSNEQLDEPAQRLVAAAKDVAGLVAGAVKDALGIDASDTSRLAALREDFYGRTQTGFFDTLKDLGEALRRLDERDSAWPTAAAAFLAGTLRPTAFSLFDHAAPLLRPEAREAERIVKARLSLVLALAGYGKRGEALFGTLSLPLPQSKATTKTRRTAGATA